MAHHSYSPHEVQFNASAIPQGCNSIGEALSILSVQLQQTFLREPLPWLGGTQLQPEDSPTEEEDRRQGAPGGNEADSAEGCFTCWHACFGKDNSKQQRGHHDASKVLDCAQYVRQLVVWALQAMPL